MKLKKTDCADSGNDDKSNMKINITNTEFKDAIGEIKRRKMVNNGRSDQGIDHLYERNNSGNDD